MRGKTDSEVGPINQKSFLLLVHETPYFTIAVMRALTDRLRRMDEAIQRARRRLIRTRHFWPFIWGFPRP